MNTQAILSQDLTWRKVWRVGANVDTDALAPGAYMKHGDVLVAGPDFGIGSSREQAAGVLKHLGIAAVIAPSYSGLFFRNSFNLGLLLLTCEEAEILQENEHVQCWKNHATQALVLKDGRRLACADVPPCLSDMVQAGGLVNLLKQRKQGTSHA